MKKINTLVCIALFLAVVGVVLLFYYIWVVADYWGGWCNVTCDTINNDVLLQLKKNIGDFLWGTLGILYTIATTIFLFVTFYDQKRQIKEAKADADRARFETTYFNLLGMLKQVQDNVNANISSNLKSQNVQDLAAYYKYFMSEYKKHLDADVSLKSIMDAFDFNKSNAASLEQLQGVLANEFESFVKNTGCNVSFFYRYIYNSIKFVDDFANQEADRNLYLNLLQAQLSNEELSLLFYDAISKYGRDKDNNYKFKNLLDDTNFLDNIEENYLLDRKHYAVYSNTLFKFLNRDELKIVISRRKSNKKR